MPDRRGSETLVGALRWLAARSGVGVVCKECVEMKTIPLTQGKVAIVDTSDYEWLNRFKWYATKGHQTYYAVRNITVGKKRRRLQQMHRIILGLQRDDKRQCDHRDSNGLNNQLSNLRVCTSRQNCRSQRKKGNISKYKGVHWNKRADKWRSLIRTNEKRIYLGLFNSEIDAARAYDVAAPKHHGNFAITNKMLGLL